MAIYLIETGALNGSTLVPLRACDGRGYNQRGAPGYYRGTVAAGGLGSFVRAIPLPGEEFTGADFGECILLNVDGIYDPFGALQWKGQPYVIKRLADENAPYASAETVLRASVAAINEPEDEFRLALASRRVELEKPVLTRRFRGDNATVTDLEGTPDDLKGKLIPHPFGKVLNHAPPCCNTSEAIYALSKSQINDVLAGYVNGRPMTKGANKVTPAALVGVANAPAPGTFTYTLGDATTPAYARVGFDVGLGGAVVTFDVEGDARGGVYRSTGADIGKELLVTYAGWDPATAIVQGDLDTLNTLNSAVIGFVVDDETPISAWLDLIFNRTLTAPWYIDQLGRFRARRFAPLLGSPDFRIRDLTPGTAGAGRAGDVRLIEEPSIVERIPPAWSIKLYYGKNENVQTTGLDANISAARKAFLREQYRVANPDPDTALHAANPLAREVEIYTAYVNEADALAEATRLRPLLGVPSEKVMCPVGIDRTDPVAVDIGKVGSLDHARHGYDGGRNIFPLSLAYDLDNDRLEITGWRQTPKLAPVLFDNNVPATQTLAPDLDLQRSSAATALSAGTSMSQFAVNAPRFEAVSGGIPVGLLLEGSTPAFIPNANGFGGFDYAPNNLAAPSTDVPRLFGNGIVFKHVRGDNPDNNCGAFGSSVVVGLTSGLTYSSSLWAYVPSWSTATSATISHEEVGGIVPVDHSKAGVDMGIRERWQRIFAADRLDRTSIAAVLRITGPNDGNATVYTTAWSTQLGPFPSSYVPTTNGEGWRAADVLTRVVDATVVNANEGTLFFEGDILGYDRSTYRALLTLDDGSSANRLGIYIDTASQQLAAYLRIGGATVTAVGSGVVPAPNGRFRVVASYDVRGSITVTATGGTPATGMPILSLPAFSMFRIGDGDAPTFGHAARAGYRAKATANVQAQHWVNATSPWSFDSTPLNYNFLSYNAPRVTIPNGTYDLYTLSENGAAWTTITVTAGSWVVTPVPGNVTVKRHAFFAAGQLSAAERDWYEAISGSPA